MKKEPLINLKDIKKDYVIGTVTTHALKGVNFEVHEGEFIAIMGSSGSGKSTLMHILGFLDTPTSGSYKFDGVDMKKYTEDELANIRNKKVGFVFQTFNLLPRTSVLDNVILPMIYAGIEEKEQAPKAKEVLEAVGLGHRLNNLSNELSGGEQQRVAVARALINKPRVILADEPTGNLDSETTIEVMKVFRELHEKGHTIIIVTHEEEVSSVTKRIVKMKDGVLYDNT